MHEDENESIPIETLDTPDTEEVEQEGRLPVDTSSLGNPPDGGNAHLEEGDSQVDASVDELGADAPETADEDIDRELSDVLLEAFREGWVAGVDLHPTYFPAETGTEMRRRITEALNARPEGTRIPWMFPAALIATFRRRGYLAWRDGNGWEGAVARWQEGCSMVFDWFSYSVVDPDGFGNEPESEREAD